MPSIFAKIISREIPAHIVAEDHVHLAFLDINPLVFGHVLVIPKKEVNYIFYLEDHELTAMHLFAKRVAIALEKAIPCVRIGVSVIGLEVPHAHIHLIPLNKIEDMNFCRMKLAPSNVELADVAKKIIDAF